MTNTVDRNTQMPDEAAMRTAVANRDAQFDGVFVYGVLTTGVYCRPSCPARAPDGDVLSYTEVATGIGAPKSVRAAAAACAANRIAILVPCHRVLRSDGGLAGYRWGLERKRVLLDQERSRRSP